MLTATAWKGYKSLIHQYFRTIAEPRAEVNRTNFLERHHFQEPLSTSTDIRGAAHSTRAGRHPGVFRLAMGMGSESGKRGGQVRLPAIGTSNRIAITANQLFEFASAIFTNVFKNGHFRPAPDPGSLRFILAQRAGQCRGWLNCCSKQTVVRRAVPGKNGDRHEISRLTGLAVVVLKSGNEYPVTTFFVPHS